MKDLTQGNEGKLIFFFALPMLLGNLLQQMYQVIDSVIVGHVLGKQALAAVGASFPITFAFVSLIIGIGIGGTVVVSQYYGAKQLDNVRKAVDTLYLFMFYSAIILTVIGVLFSEQILRFINTPADILPDATIFLRIYFLGLISFFGFNGTSSILRGLGDSKTPLYFLLVSTVLNIGLDLLFIIEFHWGVAGAAIATVISQTVAFVAGMVYLNRKSHLVSFKIKEVKFDKEIFFKSLKIGLPAGLQQTFVSFGMVAVMSIVNSFGTDVVAAYAAAGRLDSLATLPAMNFSMALSAFVGQNMGAGRSDRVRSGLVATIKLSSIVSLGISLLVILAGTLLMRLFTTDSNVIAIGHQYLIIVGCFYVVFNFMFCINGVTRGAGDTLIPMIITLFGLWIIRIPAAWLLSKPFGAVGIWWAIPMAWAIGAVLQYTYYKSGRWKKKAIVKK